MPNTGRCQLAGGDVKLHEKKILLTTKQFTYHCLCLTKHLEILCCTMNTMSKCLPVLLIRDRFKLCHLPVISIHLNYDFFLSLFVVLAPAC